jgi:hypothetical protein
MFHINLALGVKLKKAGEIKGWNAPCACDSQNARASAELGNSGISVVVLLVIVYVLGRKTRLVFHFCQPNAECFGNSSLKCTPTSKITTQVRLKRSGLTVRRVTGMRETAPRVQALVICGLSNPEAIVNSWL